MATNNQVTALDDTAGIESLPSLPQAMVAAIVAGETVVGTAGADTLEIDGVTQIEAQGLGGNDLITVTGGSSTVHGNKGDDKVDVTGPVDFVAFYGGYGRDHFDLSDSGIAGVDIDMRIKTVQTAAVGFDVLLNGVETLFGTADADRLTGNAQGNKIAGHGGTDVIYGLGGADRLFASEGGTELDPVLMFGGAGSDIINFRIGTALIYGAGLNDANDKHRDKFSFADSGQGGTIDLRETGAQQISLDTTVTMSGIEDLSGSFFDDVFTGTVGRNWMAGLSGDDTLVGLGGKDKLFGDDGEDTLKAGGGADELYGGNNNDLLNGAGGADMGFGGLGNDRIFGGLGNDQLFGDKGSDKIYGQGNNDKMYGGLGNDQLFGGAGNDRGEGGDGKDLINLGAGNDVADGGKGIDRIVGGTGDDTMTGGFGADTFVLLGNSGDDVIEDFKIGVDKMDMDASLKFGDLSISQNGANALVEFNGNSVLLKGIDGDDLSGSDFLF